MNILPTSITRDGPSHIVIHWSDASSARLAAGELRKRCPCATCREKKSAGDSAPGRPLSLPVLSMSEAQPLRIEGMRPVGNYAYNIAFSDGHDSGIFTFEYLLELGRA